MTSKRKWGNTKIAQRIIITTLSSTFCTITSHIFRNRNLADWLVLGVEQAHICSFWRSIHTFQASVWDPAAPVFGDKSLKYATLLDLISAEDKILLKSNVALPSWVAVVQVKVVLVHRHHIKKKIASFPFHIINTWTAIKESLMIHVYFNRIWRITLERISLAILLQLYPSFDQIY